MDQNTADVISTWTRTQRIATRQQEIVVPRMCTARPNHLTDMTGILAHAISLGSKTRIKIVGHLGALIAQVSSIPGTELVNVGGVEKMDIAADRDGIIMVVVELWEQKVITAVWKDMSGM